MRAINSLVRYHHFPFSASAFDVVQSFGNFRKWIRSVDDDLQFFVLDEFGKQSEVAAAWMHKEIAIADAFASSPRSDPVADEPEDGGKNSAAA
jgi:hypothetical protein